MISGIYRKSPLLSPFSSVTDLGVYCFANLPTVKCVFSPILPGVQALNSTETQQKPPHSQSKQT